MAHSFGYSTVFGSTRYRVLYIQYSRLVDIFKYLTVCIVRYKVKVYSIKKPPPAPLSSPPPPPRASLRTTGAFPTMADRARFARAGEAAFNKSEKISSELFTLTYGAVVMQLVADYEDVREVNAQLFQLGRRMGQRLVDELFAKAGPALGTRCADFRDSAEVVAKTGFRMFLGIGVDVAGWNAEGTACSLVFAHGNPLTNFVELPADKGELKYCNVLCGVVQGALEMVKMNVKCDIVSDTLKGAETDEIRLELLNMIDEEMDEAYIDE